MKLCHSGLMFSVAVPDAEDAAASGSFVK